MVRNTDLVREVIPAAACRAQLPAHLAQERHAIIVMLSSGGFPVLTQWLRSCRLTVSLSTVRCAPGPTGALVAARTGS